MTSAVNPWDTESQPSVTHCPARHICLILFGRMVPPLALFIDPTIGLVSFKLKPPPEARAAPTQPQDSAARRGPCELSLRGAQRRGNLGQVRHLTEIAASLRSSQ